MIRFNRTLAWMTAFLVLVGILVVLVHARLLEMFNANPFFNGVILSVLVAGIIAPTTGEMTFLGEPLGYHRRNSLRRQIQYIYQEPVAALDPKMSVQRIIEEPIRLYYDYSAPDRQELAVSLLKDVGLSPDLRTRRPKELSGGQCQRIGIARALAGNPKVLVCDEPTSALDSTIQAQILDLMRELKEQKGFAYIFITHSLGVVRAVSNRIMVVQRGRIVESGSTSQILDDPRSEYTRTLLASVPRIDIPYYEI